MRRMEVIVLEIGLSLILDELGLEADVHLPSDINPRFTSAELYVVGEPQFSPDKLLVSLLSEAIAAEKSPGAYFLCIRDRMVDGMENETAMSGITVIRSNVGMRDLFNRVQRVFVKVNNWVMAMERSNAKRGGFQELLDLSEPIFHNFITIQDSTFKLIAHTKNIKTTDVLMTRLVKQGYHPPETMELLQRLRRVEQYRTSTDIIVSRDRLTSDHDVVKKTYHVGGSIFIMIVMVCCGKEACRGILELFAVFIEYIKAYADLEIAQTGGSGGVKKLTLDILAKNAGNKEEARIRSVYCGYPFDGDFRLCVFSFKDESNVPIAKIVQTLEQIQRGAVAFSCDKRVLLIAQEEPDIKALGKINALNTIEFTCGISDNFYCLWDLPTAYEQAITASELHGKLLSKSSNFYYFTENLVTHIVSAAFDNKPGVFENTFPARAIKKLHEHDARQRTETAKLLKLFLEKERSATAVSQEMHMHRNTVLYHMEKVSELLGISLNDPETRLQLLLAFRAEDLENKTIMGR